MLQTTRSMASNGLETSGTLSTIGDAKPVSKLRGLIKKWEEKKIELLEKDNESSDSDGFNLDEEEFAQ